MEVFARPHRSYYEWQINNGEGFELELYSDEMVNYWKLFSMKQCEVYIGCDSHYFVKDMFGIRWNKNQYEKIIKQMK